MPRALRPIDDDLIYHVIKRDNHRQDVLHKPADFQPWLRGTDDDKELLARWPISRRPNWVEQVNAPLTAAELTAVQHRVLRGRPFGNASWSEKTVHQLHLESTLRRRGRPTMQKNGS